jgi:hypothetical protein
VPGGKPLGCGKCRWAKAGCKRCRVEAVVPQDDSASAAAAMELRNSCGGRGEVQEAPRTAAARARDFAVTAATPAYTAAGNGCGFTGADGGGDEEEDGGADQEAVSPLAGTRGPSAEAAAEAEALALSPPRPMELQPSPQPQRQQERMPGHEEKELPATKPQQTGSLRKETSGVVAQMSMPAAVKRPAAGDAAPPRDVKRVCNKRQVVASAGAAAVQRPEEDAAAAAAPTRSKSAALPPPAVDAAAVQAEAAVVGLLFARFGPGAARGYAAAAAAPDEVVGMLWRRFGLARVEQVGAADVRGCSSWLEGAGAVPLVVVPAPPEGLEGAVGRLLHTRSGAAGSMRHGTLRGGGRGGY